MKRLGISPIPMMDREKKDEIPQGQVRQTIVCNIALYRNNCNHKLLACTISHIQIIRYIWPSV